MCGVLSHILHQGLTFVIWPHPYGSNVSLTWGSFGYVSAGVRGPCRKSYKKRRRTSLNQMRINWTMKQWVKSGSAPILPPPNRTKIANTHTHTHQFDDAFMVVKFVVHLTAVRRSKPQENEIKITRAHLPMTWWYKIVEYFCFGQAHAGENIFQIRRSRRKIWVGVPEN